MLPASVGRYKGHNEMNMPKLYKLLTQCTNVCNHSFAVAIDIEIAI